MATSDRNPYDSMPIIPPMGQHQGVMGILNAIADNHPTLVGTLGRGMSQTVDDADGQPDTRAKLMHDSIHRGWRKTGFGAGSSTLWWSKTKGLVLCTLDPDNGRETRTLLTDTNPTTTRHTTPETLPDDSIRLM